MTAAEYETMAKVMRAILYTLKWHRRDLSDQEQRLEAERMYVAWKVWEEENKK